MIDMSLHKLNFKFKHLCNKLKFLSSSLKKETSQILFDCFL